MQQLKLLHNIIENAGAIGHKARLNSLVNTVENVMNGANLSVASLGRHLGKK